MPWWATPLLTEYGYYSLAILVQANMMVYDYGYRRGVSRMYSAEDGTIPASGLTLAVSGFTA